jgi:hypothetical protein
MGFKGYQPRRRSRPQMAVALDRVPRERCCCGKVPYVSEGEAKGVRRAMQRSRLQGANGLHVYGCDRRPGVWHIGMGKGA